MAFQFALGPAGALVPFRAPSPDYASSRTRLGGTHELLAGLVRDTIGFRRTITLKLPTDLTAEQYSALETLFELPGPYRFVDPTRRNLLTANQSTGTDALRDTTGIIARFGGSVSSSTAQARSGSRSIAWAVTPSGTGQGIYLQGSTSTVDQTWAVVRPSTQYTVTGYMRSTLAISMKAGMDWYDAAGAFISADTGGSGQALSTSAWTTRVTRTTPAAPSSVAYGIPWFTNTTTGAAMTVFLDDPQMEEGTTANPWVFGTGVPLVTIDSLEPDYSNWYADATPPLLGATMTLLEIT
jgi:hypothetical protein